MELGGVLGTARSPKPRGESPILSPPARLSSSAGSSAGFVNRRSSVRARPGALLHSCVFEVVAFVCHQIVFFENRIAVAAPRLVVWDAGHWVLRSMESTRLLGETERVRFPQGPLMRAVVAQG